MRSIVILFLLVGICLVVVGYVQSNQACPPPVVEFRYLPQTFEQEQNLQQPVLSTFGTMFNQDDAWMYGGPIVHGKVEESPSGTAQLLS